MKKVRFFVPFARAADVRHHGRPMTRVRVVLSLLLFSGTAAAQAPALCPPDHVGCTVEDVDFTHRDALFDDVMLDSGWVPADAAVQVRFAVFIGGSTQVDMGGTSVTSWPGA